MLKQQHTACAAEQIKNPWANLVLCQNRIIRIKLDRVRQSKTKIWMFL